MLNQVWGIEEIKFKKDFKLRIYIVYIWHTNAECADIWCKNMVLKRGKGIVKYTDKVVKISGLDRYTLEFVKLEETQTETR